MEVSYQITEKKSSQKICRCSTRNWFKNIRIKGKKLGKYLERKQGDSIIWNSNDMAKEWCVQVMNALSSKIAAFNKEDFQKFEKNWLVITERLLFEFLDLDIALGLLNSEIKSFKKNIQYNEVFIVTKIRGEKILINITGNKFEVIAKKAV